MQDYDALPPPLRRWLSEAILPWSPASCRRIWHAARLKGESDAALIARLDRAERKTLARDPLFACNLTGSRAVPPADEAKQ